MMEESSPESARGAGHGWGWAMALVAVPVVYVLSLSPVAILCRGAGGSPLNPPKWFQVYAMPGLWLYEYVPPLQEPLEAYDKWWNEMM